jgi:hypothetical protein
VCSSSSKLSLPCAKRLCHFSTIAQGFVTIHLPDLLRHFASGFA